MIDVIQAYPAITAVVPYECGNLMKRTLTIRGCRDDVLEIRQEFVCHVVSKT